MSFGGVGPDVRVWFAISHHTICTYHPSSVCVCVCTLVRCLLLSVRAVAGRQRIFETLPLLTICREQHSQHISETIHVYTLHYYSIQTHMCHTIGIPDHEKYVCNTHTTDVLWMCLSCNGSLFVFCFRPRLIEFSRSDT